MTSKRDFLQRELTGWCASAMGAALLCVAEAAAAAAPATDAGSTANLATNRSYSIGEVISQSVTGDVYAHPENWEELGFRNLFSKGWDRPWTSPVNGGGGAPRQGWLNAYDGVFYRLSLAIFGWQHQLLGGDGYSGNLYSYTPLSERFEVQSNIPLVTATRYPGDPNRQANFGDLMVAPTVMLSETRDVSQSLMVAFRMPTGDIHNGRDVAAVSPTYQFWANWWKGLVLRGGAGFSIPYAGDIQGAHARSTFNSNLALGWYFTDHDFTPIGDLVWYVSTNFNQALDNRGPASLAMFTVGPGFRSHVGDNWYLLGSVEVPVTQPQPYDYQVQGAIMKVY